MSSDNGKRLFLETTIQVFKIFGHPNCDRKEINKILESHKLVTSTYVLKEFKLGFIKAAVDFYNLICDSENISEALRRTDKGFFGRQQSKIINIYALVIENLGEGLSLSKKQVLKRLNYFINGYLERKFYKNIETPLIDKTKCVFADFNPTKNDEDGLWEYKPSCRKSDPNDCEVQLFVEKNIEILKEIVEQYNLNSESKVDEETKRRNQTAIKIISDDDVAYGRRNCNNLSDWLICLEVPEDVVLFTINRKHYEIPCDLLNIRLYDAI